MVSWYHGIMVSYKHVGDPLGYLKCAVLVGSGSFYCKLDYCKLECIRVSTNGAEKKLIESV